MKRVNENPPSRFPERRIHESRYPWWIAKVKPRQEKAFAFDLICREIEYYLPLYTKVTRRKDNNKPRKSVLPLFPGYVAYAAGPGHEREVYATDRVVNIVEVRHQKRFMKELEQIYYTLDCGMPLEPIEDPGIFAAGMAVRVEAGPLRGIHGTIVRVQSLHKLVLSVEGLGRAAVTVDAGLVKAL